MNVYVTGSDFPIVCVSFEVLIVMKMLIEVYVVFSLEHSGHMFL
jgi:hypothetical protein